MPGFCLGPDFAGPTADMRKGYWDLWPLDNPARPHPLTETERLCRPVRITARTPGVALISYLHEGRGLFVELFLSTTEIVENGLSPFEDWVSITRGAMDDVSQEVVLRLDFGLVTPQELAGFRSERKLVTTDLTLEVRPRV